MEKPALSNTIFATLATVEDPRAGNAIHPLENVLFICIVGVLCGADGFVQVERMARLKRGLLEEYLDLSSGLPTHDTLSRVLAALAPDAFRSAFQRFIAQLTGQPLDDVIQIDGKTLRGALNKRQAAQARAEDQVHMVSAFSRDRNVVLGQLRSAAVANEEHAARQLLQLIDVEGAVVTLDAAHTRKETLELIKERGGEAVITLKANQRTLLRDAKEGFRDYADEATVITTEEVSRGRVEHRRYEVLDARGCPSVDERFTAVRSFIRVTRIRVLKDNSNRANETYYLSTLPPSEAARIADAIRHRWGIENKLHYVLDMAFDEDRCRVRTGNAAENLSRIRHIALSLMHLDKIESGGLKTKRLVAAADNNYLRHILRLDAGRHA